MPCSPTRSWRIRPRKRARAICRANCAAWCARTSRSTIPRRRWRAILRLLVRERIAAGDSDSQVIDFLVARYGEFVLLKPRFNPHTLLLWLLPPLALAGGGLALWTYSRRRSKFPDAEDPALAEIDAGGRSPAGAPDRGANLAGKAGLSCRRLQASQFPLRLSASHKQATSRGNPHGSFTLRRQRGELSADARRRRRLSRPRP